MQNIILCFLGYLTSTVVGAGVIFYLVEKGMWKELAKENSDCCKNPKNPVITIKLGIIERILYTTVLIMGYWQWIGLWLTLKTVVKWDYWKDKNRDYYNIFLIGNGLSVFFGFLGAWIAVGFKMLPK